MTTKVFHFIWVGSPVTMAMQGRIRSWVDMNPGWTYRLWDQQDLTDLENQDLFDRAEELVPADAVGQFRSDVARYEILQRHGGFYTDFDTRPLKPLDERMFCSGAWAAMEDIRWVGNTYLYSDPEHPLLKRIVTGIAANVAHRPGPRPNKLTGPQYITPVWCEFAERGEAGLGHHTRWFPYSYSHVKAGNVPTEFGDDVCAVHEWHHTQELLTKRAAHV